MAYATINKPNTYFNTVLYTGDGTSPRSITGVNFKPDFVWTKNRSASNSNTLGNVVMGTGKTLFTDSSSSEYTNNTYGYHSSFNTDGFSVTGSAASAGGDNVNKSSNNYVSWNWLGANTTVSNTQGNLTSTVSVNTTNGFSVLGYTTNSTANRTIGHGLGVAPAMIIIKNRNAVSDWAVYHKSLGNTNWIRLNTDGITYADSGYWNNTSPTSTVFTIGATNTNVNDTSGNTYDVYCFAEIKGFSKFNSYTGNGSTDGTFVYTGFKPAFVLTKASSSTGQWIIHDSARDPFNQTNKLLYPSLSSAESDITDQIDILSNGFKMRATGSAINGSGTTYIYAAFAENPLVGTNNIPTTAR